MKKAAVTAEARSGTSPTPVVLREQSHESSALAWDPAPPTPTADGPARSAAAGGRTTSSSTSRPPPPLRRPSSSEEARSYATASDGTRRCRHPGRRHAARRPKKALLHVAPSRSSWRTPGTSLCMGRVHADGRTSAGGFRAGLRRLARRRSCRVFFAGVFTAALSVPRPGDRDVEEKDPEVIRLTRTKKPETVATDEARARRRGHPVRLRHAALGRSHGVPPAPPPPPQTPHVVVVLIKSSFRPRPPPTARTAPQDRNTCRVHGGRAPALLLQAVPHGRGVLRGPGAEPPSFLGIPRNTEYLTFLMEKQVCIMCIQKYIFHFIEN
jgi:hypothetical protein